MAGDWPYGAYFNPAVHATAPGAPLSPIGCTCGKPYWSIIPIPCPVHSVMQHYVYEHPVTITTTTGTATAWPPATFAPPVPPDYAPS